MCVVLQRIQTESHGDGQVAAFTFKVAGKIACLFCAAIFGQSLEQTLQYEQKRRKSSKVPHIVECCIAYLRENGLHEEGLFRCNTAAAFSLLCFVHARFCHRHWLKTLLFSCLFDL